MSVLYDVVRRVRRVREAAASAVAERPREAGSPRPAGWGAGLGEGESSPGAADSESSGRCCGRARTPARESEPVREAGRVARRRTAPGEPVDARRGVGVPAQPGRPRHGTRRGRAVLQRLRTVVRGRRNSARHDEALRRTPEQTGSGEAGRRRGWRRPGSPVVHEPRRARRGPHPSRRLQFNLITARYSPGSLSA